MMPETAKRMARVPILGEDGRISDDYVPAAIGEGVESAEAAATRAETAATAAEGSASAASQSATQAASSASAASTSASQAQESAATAGGAATSAQSAQQAAEAAKTRAESARDSAQTSASQAQQSATAAADSAASVADKFIASAQATTLEPGSQATATVENQVLTIGVPKGEKGDKGDAGDKGEPGTGVPDGGTPGQLLSKTDSGTAWVDPPSTGNVVTGTSTDLVSHGEDAYAQKPIEVRVKGKTWVNRWPVLNQPDGTATTDETGLITINATPEQTLYINAPAQGIAANKAYTLFVSNASGASNSTWTVYVEERDADGTYIASESIVASRPSVTFTTKANCAQLQCMIIVYAGYAANLTTRVMLVDGTEAPDCFMPCASITSVETSNLVTAGKNLFQYTKQAGIFFTGGILRAGTYTMSLESLADWWTNNAGNGRSIYYYMYDNLEAAAAAAAAGSALRGYSSAGSINFANADVGVRSSAPFTPRTSGCVLFVAYYGATWIDQVTNIQLELGSTSTAYEPPTVTETPLPEVELRGLPDGTCDELVIKADGSCEVERRTGYIASYTDEEVTGEYVSTGNGLEAGASIVYELDEPATEPQSPVTLPALPAPTFNQYHDADVPSDTSTEYVRDINIVIDNLVKQVAGTAATVAINEATR